MSNLRIAILLSGRVKIYDEFLKMLHSYHRANPEYDIDVFISVNDTYNSFYDKLKQDFGIYCKELYCEPYILPTDFHTIHRGNKMLPYKVTMSCYWNDRNVFDMACKYADEHNSKYDIYLRTRSDICYINNKLPEFDPRYKDGILFCAHTAFDNSTLYYTDDPANCSRVYGDPKYNGKEPTADIAYGNREAMNVYCKTYEHVLKEHERNNGNYFIWFESSISTYLYDCGYPWEFFKYDYSYCPNRRWANDYPPNFPPS